ncbi:MAG: acyl carrier protein [Bryobacteraceae bacterium]|jgi:acyl carrier protein|nr:acyl carrier protein [Bryobacteraceae bacterium]
MTLRDRVASLLKETVCRGKDFNISDEDSLLESGLLDSLGMLELVEVLKKRLGVIVDEDDLMPENLDSVAALTAFLERKGVQG